MIAFSDLVLALVCLFVAACFWWYASIPKNLPPGPAGLPFLGSSFDTWKADTVIQKLLQWKEKYGGVYKFYIANKLVVVLSDWDSIQEGLVKQGDVYAGRPSLRAFVPKSIDSRAGLVPSEGDLWKEHRRFTLSTLREFGFGRPIIEPRIKTEVEFMIGEIEKAAGKPVDPGYIINNAVSNVICFLVFGRRFDYRDERFHKLLELARYRLTESGICILSPLLVSEKLASMVTCLPRVKKFLREGDQLAGWIRAQVHETLRDYKADGEEEPTNYVHAFRKVQLESDPTTTTFTEMQLVGSVLNLFVAGTDTTATTLRWGIYYMASNPDLQEKVYQEIREHVGTSILPNYSDRTRLPLTEATICETQRLANLVPLGVLRRTHAPSRLGKYDIPEDTIITPFLTSALMDPEVYPEPTKFDPYRFLDGKSSKSAQFTHLIPFQAGKRVCLGEPLARMELFLFFVSLISRFKFSFPRGTQAPEREYRFSFVRAPAPFEVCAELRTE